jgi:polyvinyl alcohol dehydrogenase (cytochrome)
MLAARIRSNQGCETTHCCEVFYGGFQARRYYKSVSPVRVLFVTLSVLSLVSQSFAADWKMFAATPEHTSYNSAETAINRDTISTLQRAWAQVFKGGFAAAPTVVNRILYVGGWNGYFYAMDGTDGRVLWQTYVGKAAEPELPQCQVAIGVTAQAVVSGNTVLVGGGDSAVYALNKDTGAQIWRTQLADPASGAYIWSSLTLVNNSLYVGIASLGDCPLVRGLLARIDLNAPDQPQIRYLAPEDQVGAGIWSTPAVDVKTNTVYVTTGTGDQDADLGLWGGTLLALDATTLDIKSYYFLPTNSTDEDIEWGSSPTLYTGTNGRRLVAATGKDGILYGLTAPDLSVLYQTKLALQCICPECGCGSLSTPSFDGKYLYVGAGVADPTLFDSGSVYSIMPDDGSIRWVRTTPGTVIAPVTVAGSFVYAATTTGLNVFDAATGDVVWTDGNYAGMFSQPVVIEGTVYCTYVNGDVVAWRPQANAPDQPGAKRGAVPHTRSGG